MNFDNIGLINISNLCEIRRKFGLRCWPIIGVWKTKIGESAINIKSEGPTIICFQRQSYSRDLNRANQKNKLDY